MAAAAIRQPLTRCSRLARPSGQGWSQSPLRCHLGPSAGNHAAWLQVSSLIFARQVPAVQRSFAQQTTETRLDQFPLAWDPAGVRLHRRGSWIRRPMDTLHSGSPNHRAAALATPSRSGSASVALGPPPQPISQRARSVSPPARMVVLIRLREVLDSEAAPDLGADRACPRGEKGCDRLHVGRDGRLSSVRCSSRGSRARSRRPELSRRKEFAGERSWACQTNSAFSDTGYIRG